MGNIIKAKKGPEKRIQESFEKFLRARKWLVERMHGNAFQTGVPDIYIHHAKYGYRWIDFKNPKSYSFTMAQRIKWPIWERHGVGIWIITGSDQENYDKLFAPPNLRDYLKDSDTVITSIDQLLEDIIHEAGTET